ncbi:hypothetical protein HQ587_09675 [bacterium]|nr:hypothetical protein [bacterium]
MCEKSLKSILDREIAVVSLKPHVEKPIKELEIEVNYATYLLGRLLTCKNNYTKPPILLFRHIIEMVDAISVMIPKSVVIPARLILRSEFEALLSILYILQDPFTYEFRSMSFLYFTRKTRLRDTKIIKTLKVDKNINPEHRDMAALFDQQVNLDNDVAVLEKLLSSPKYAEIRNEERKKLKPKNWFSLRGGPISRETLADCVGQRTQYQTLYRMWSKGTHAVELDNQVILEDGIEKIRELRGGTEFQANMNLALNFLREAIMELIKFYRPEEMENFSNRRMAQLSDDERKNFNDFISKYK